MGKTFEEWWQETKVDHMDEIMNWLVTDTIFGPELNEDRVYEYLLNVWQQSRFNLTYRDI